MRLHGRLDTRAFDSKLLAGNPLGDPTDRDVYVYTPPGYDEGSARLPMVMVLAGYGATNHTIVGRDVFKPNLIERFDAMVHDGDCPPALLVLPDASNRWGGSQFVDSGATGPYQRYLVDEVVPFVDAAYRTIPEREGRAVVGKSSGGFGALRIGIDRPEAFGVIGSHAGDSAFDISIRPELTSVAIALDRAGGIASFVEAFRREPGRHSFGAMMTIAYGAAYAPDMQAPPAFTSMPFDAATGVLDDAQWSRWLDHDPLVRLRRDEDALSQAQLIFIDAGNRDEHGLHFGSRMIAKILRERGRPVEYEEFDGGHRGTAYRYETSLPRLIAACGAATG